MHETGVSYRLTLGVGKIGEENFFLKRGVAKGLFGT